MNTVPLDYDSPWKEALERYFKDFMAFFFPTAHAGIDWTRGYEFLDKEYNVWCAVPNWAGVWWTSWCGSGA